MEEGAKQAKAGTIKGNPQNKISTTDKTQRMREAERQVEGGITMPDQADKQIPPNANIVASMVTMRQSVTRRRESRPS